MKEQFSQPETLPRISSKSESSSYIDRNISDTLLHYLLQTQNEERTKFRDLPSLSKKIDHICWMWALNPETVAAAVDLRSLHAIRTLEDAVVSEDPAADRDFKLPSDNPFWARVDVQLYEHLGKFVKEETGIALPELCTLPTTAPYDLFVLDDYVITRVPTSQDNLVHYTAMPQV